ncbi:MAG: hypothetical protein ACLRWP_06240 [Bilophila wadsworthia]
MHIHGGLRTRRGPALRSMFTGYVPLEHIRHHNPLWFRKLAEPEKE